jgi:hypothetical protein
MHMARSRYLSGLRLSVVLTPKSVKRFDDVGDQSCCGADNPFSYGGCWAKGPFACESAESGLACKKMPFATP